MQVISENVYYEDKIPGVTLGAIILRGGTLLVDTPLRSEDARSWKSTILTQSRGTHRILVNLDEHYDRTIGNRLMGLPVMAHKNAVSVYENRATVFKGQSEETGSVWEKYPDVIGSRWTPPNITFSEQIQIHWADGEIQIHHHPGPTPSALWVEMPTKKIIFVGDAVLDNQPPFLGLADLPNWIEALSLLRSPKYRDYIFVSGRSGPVTVDVVRNQHEYLKSLLGRLETLSNKTTDPAETEKMIPSLLSKFEFPSHMEGFYSKRLSYGLYQYFSKYYCPSDNQEEH